MGTTRRWAAAALVLALPASAVQAGDMTWGCEFKPASGLTGCMEVTENGERTGRIVISQPNVGLPGDYWSTHGDKVTVYLGGHKTGHQKFHWQE